MYKYFIYSKPAGEKRFLLTNIDTGTVGIGKLYAPRYTQEHLEALKEYLGLMADKYVGSVFQIRKLDGKTVVYTTK